MLAESITHTISTTLNLEKRSGVQSRNVAFHSDQNLTSCGILSKWLNLGRSLKHMGMRLCKGCGGIVGASEFEACSEVGYCWSCEFMQAEWNFNNPGGRASVSEPTIGRAQG